MHGIFFYLIFIFFCPLTRVLPIGVGVCPDLIANPSSLRQNNSILCIDKSPGFQPPLPPCGINFIKGVFIPLLIKRG